MQKSTWLKFACCQKGQTLLIVVLAIVIALTVGLSLASRSITNLKNTTEEANSQKALSAAEAGVERALQKITSSSESIEGNFEIDKASYVATVSALSSLAGQTLKLNGGNVVGKDEGVDLWFVSHDTNGVPDYNARWNGNLSVYWGEVGDTCSESQTANTRAALEVVIISGSKDVPVLTRYALDPCTERANINKFTSIAGGGSGNFPYGTTIAVTNGLIARIIPLYANTIVAVNGNNPLPSQGSIISSVGKSGSTERKVSVFQGYPSLPAEYFPNNFFYHSL